MFEHRTSPHKNITTKYRKMTEHFICVQLFLSYRYIYKNYKLPIRGEAAIGFTVASPSPSVAMAATYQANMPPLEIPNCQVGYRVSNSHFYI